MIPWPHGLSHLAHHPASITLPPRRSHVLALMRESLRCLQTRCRIDPTDAYIEDITGAAGQELLRLLQKIAQHFLIKWIDTSRFFVQYFDYNTSTIWGLLPCIGTTIWTTAVGLWATWEGLGFRMISQFSEILALTTCHPSPESLSTCSPPA